MAGTRNTEPELDGFDSEALVVVSFYKFADFPDHARMRQPLKQLCEELVLVFLFLLFIYLQFFFYQFQFIAWSFLEYSVKGIDFNLLAIDLVLHLISYF